MKTALPWCHFDRTFPIGVMRNICGGWHFYGLEVLCEVLMPFGKILAAVSTNSFPQLREFAGFIDES